MNDKTNSVLVKCYFLSEIKTILYSSCTFLARIQQNCGVFLVIFLTFEFCECFDIMKTIYFWVNSFSHKVSWVLIRSMFFFHSSYERKNILSRLYNLDFWLTFSLFCVSILTQITSDFFFYSFWIIILSIILNHLIRD